MHFNQSGYQGSLDSCNQTALPFLQQIIDKFHQLDQGKLSGSDLPALFADPKGFVFNKMQKGQEVKLFGVTVKKEKAVEMLDMPPALEELTALISRWEKQARSQYGENFFNVRYFDLEGEKVVISEFLKDMLKNSNSIFAESKQEKVMFEALSKVADLLEDLRTNLGGNRNMKKLFDQCITQQGTWKEEKVIIRPEGIKGLRQVDYSVYP